MGVGRAVALRGEKISIWGGPGHGPSFGCGAAGCLAALTLGREHTGARERTGRTDSRRC
jgi:hypothetical protein